MFGYELDAERKREMLVMPSLERILSNAPLSDGMAQSRRM